MPRRPRRVRVCALSGIQITEDNEVHIMINTGRYASSPLIYIFSCELERRSQVCAVVRCQLLCFFPSFSEDAPVVFSPSLPLPLSADSGAPRPSRVSPYLISIFLPSTCSRIHISTDLLLLPNICPPSACVTKVRRARSSPPLALSPPRRPHIHPIHQLVWISASILRAPPRKQSFEISLPFSFSPEHVSPRDGFPHPSPGTRAFFTISCQQLPLLPPSSSKM